MTFVHELLKTLNDQQREAVLHDGGPAVVLAGAGSGKTRVLTTRAIHLIQEKGIQPDEILLVTFTNKAAGEINKRILKLTGQKLPFSGTFHSLCARILRQHAHHLGRDTNFTIYDSGDQQALLKQIYRQHQFDPKKYKPRMVHALISQAKNEMLSPEEYQGLAHDKTQEFVAKVYRLYQQALQKQSALDFDDLLLETVHLFRKSKEVLDHYQQRIGHVLVDEYQDTNKAQYFLTKFLSQPQNNLYVVGDFSQSIYAWRGADYRNLMRLNQDFSDIKEYRLEKNYRSTQTILDAATRVISQNTSHPVLKLWTENISQDKIQIIETNDEEIEAEKVAQLIQTEVGLDRDDIAILYRTNAQSRPFEEVFVRKGIPYQIIGGLKFYERKEIKDLLAYLRLAVNPADTVSQERAEKNGKRRLNKYNKWLVENADKAPKMPPLELLENVLQTTEYLKKLDEDDPQDLARLENIQELLNTAAKFTSLHQFLENVALVQDGYFHDLPAGRAGRAGRAGLTPANQPKAVSLMSLHSAKGLEFPLVFMVGAEEGLLPHQRSLWEKEQMEEERRLCYVGITRAKEKLIITYARRRLSFGKVIHSTRSRFLSEIGKDLVQEIGVSEPLTEQQKVKPTQARRIINDDALDALLDGELTAKDFLSA
jgi:DNA helicase-2/ATP-dependent DNA helicase PcrA